MSLTAELVAGACPFCRESEIALVKDIDEPAHTVPYCEAFETMSSDDFVAAVIDHKHLR